MDQRNESSDNGSHPSDSPPITEQQIGDYYDRCTPAYLSFWSPEKGNIHFGYWERGMRLFANSAREAMGERMNSEVTKRLNLSETEATRVLDLGCGIGATAMHVAKTHPKSIVTGLTISSEQVRIGNEKLELADLNNRVSLILGSYTRIPSNIHTVDAAYALESSCYAIDKVALINEAHRVLRPGGRFVVADGFLKHSEKLPTLVDECYRAWCNGWAVPGLADVNKIKIELEKAGFGDVKVENISWNVMPSMAHGIWLFFYRTTLNAIRFNLRSFKELFKKGGDSRKNATAGMMTAVLGTSHKHFGYYLISATKI